MAKKTAVQKQDEKRAEFRSVCGSMLNSVVGIFIVVILAVFSLRYDKYYFNILETKTGFYTWCAVAMLVIFGVLVFIMMFIDLVEFQGANTIRFLKRLLPANWAGTFTVADAAVLLFVAVSIVSTLQSDFVKEAYLGSKGRFTGLRLNLIYVAVYFVISRTWRMKNWYFEVFLINGMLVCLLGITDYFQLDLLHFRDNINPGHATIFMSTIGNINTYTSYVALVMGFAAAMFLGTENRARRIWYFGCMVISFMAIIMGQSDNAYLALGVLFAFSPLMVFKNRDGVVRYVMMLAAFFTVVQVVDVLNGVFPERVIGLEGLFDMLARGQILVVLVVALWLAAAGLVMWQRKGAEPAVFARNLPRKAWGIFLLCGFVLLIFCLVDANALGHGERYGAARGYLVFEDQWGTNRGYIWRKSVEVYREFPLVRKLVGYGPDTFGLLSRNFYDEMMYVTGQEFDSAHNEYLHFLVTIGLLGVASYIIYLIALCQSLIQAAKNNPYVGGILWAVLCYLFQALVNINLPVVTPMLWLLMSCGMAAYRNQFHDGRQQSR